MKPIIKQADNILGSFAPLNSYYKVGPRSNYYIHEGYNHRTDISYFDDTCLEDEWQDEVYRFAKEIFVRDSFTTVVDFGCGSAFKLVKHFWDAKTFGIDVPETLAYLNNRWPEKAWIDGPNNDTNNVDMVILSDVIEHVLDPNDLLKTISSMNPKQIVISTPDRNLLRVGTFNGPPQNTTHVREWSFIEFRAYIDTWFKVTEHFISSPAQATQCILCEPYAKS